MGDDFSDFQAELEFIIELEGGKVNDPRDKGGKTNFGITGPMLKDFQSITKKLKQINDVYQLTSQQALEIMGFQYLRTKCNLIKNQGTRLAVFDAYYNHGLGSARQIFQKCLNIKPSQQAQVTQQELKEIVDKINDHQNQEALRQEIRKERLQKAPQCFRKGLENRNQKIIDRANKLHNKVPGGGGSGGAGGMPGGQGGNNNNYNQNKDQKDKKDKKDKKDNKQDKEDKEFQEILNILFGDFQNPNGPGGGNGFQQYFQKFNGFGTIYKSQRIYQKILSQVSSEKGLQLPQNFKDVNKLSQTELYDYLFNAYCRFPLCKIMDGKTRALLFDSYLTHDLQQSIKWFQEACQIQTDGVFSKLFADAVNSHNQDKLQNIILDIRKGWLREQSMMTSNGGEIKNQLHRLQKVFENSQLFKLPQQQQQPQQKQYFQQPLQKGIDADVSIQKLQNIKGINIDKQRFIIDNSKNIQISDLATVLLLYYDPSIPPQYKSIQFSLDPIIENQNQELKKQEKVCWPDKWLNQKIIQDTEIADILFQSDYLMKLISLGVQSDSQTPFNYPQQLRNKGLKPAREFSISEFNNENLCRFWLIPQECTYSNIEGKYIIDDIRVVCQTRQMVRNGNNLIDRQSQDTTHYSYKFAAKFTELYEDIAYHFPIFNRLKQLFKAIALGKFIYKNQIKIDINKLQQYSKTKINQKVIPIVKYVKESKTVTSIPVLQGVQYQTRVHTQISMGGIDAEIKEMKESKKLQQEKYDEIDIPFFPNIKCENCSRLVERDLINYNMNKCSIHNEHTCYLCFELIQNQRAIVKIISNRKYLFHENCYNEYLELQME